MADANLIDASTTTLHKKRKLSLPVWLVSICIIAFTVLLISTGGNLEKCSPRP